MTTTAATIDTSANTAAAIAAQQAAAQAAMNRQIAENTAASAKKDAATSTAQAAATAQTPATTVDNKTTQAVTPQLTQAKQEKAAAEAKLKADTAAAASVQAQLDKLNSSMDTQGATPGRLQQASELQKQSVALKAEVAADKKAVKAADAKIAAASVVLGSEQLKADKSSAAKSSKAAKQAYDQMSAVMPAGVKLPQGGMLSDAQLMQLNPAQIRAYNSYLNAQMVASRDQAKVNADVAGINRDMAVLQASPDNGRAAIAEVNKALAPQGLAIAAPQRLSPDAAQANLDRAEKAAEYFNAVYDTTNAAVANQGALRDVSTAQENIAALKQQIAQYEKDNNACLTPNAPLMQQYKQAEANLQAAYARYGKDPTTLDLNMKKAYVDKLTSDMGVTAAKQGRDQVQAAYSQWQQQHPNVPASDNPYAGPLKAANQQVALVEQQAGVADASYLASQAQVKAAQLDVTSPGPQAEAAHVEADKLTLEAYRKGADLNMSVAQTTLGNAKERLAQAQASGDQAQIKAAEGDVTKAQAAVDAAQQRQKQVDFAIKANNFENSLPANLRNPVTDADKKARAEAVGAFYVEHRFDHGGYTGADALAQVKQDLASEEKALANRGWLQSTSDSIRGVFGGDRSELETFLKDHEKKLQDLEARRGQMGEAAYRAELDSLMSNYGQEYMKLMKSERESDQWWQEVNGYARAGVALGVGIGVGIFNPALGFAAGVATYQAWDAADDAVVEAKGGDIAADGHVSLAGLGMSAYDLNQGNISQEQFNNRAWMAGTDLATEAIYSGGAVIGLGVTTRVAAFAEARIVPTVGNTLITRAFAGGAGMTANQAVMSTGQMGVTTLELYSKGELGTDAGMQKLLQQAKAEGLNMLTAPVVGMVTGPLPVRVLPQATANLGLNAAQAELHAQVFQGRHANSAELTGALVNTAPGTILTMHTNPNGAAVRNTVMERYAPEIIRNPNLTDGSARVIRGEDGQIRIEAAANATTADIIAHVETSNIAASHTGIRGYILEKLGVPKPNTPEYGVWLENQKLQPKVDMLEARLRNENLTPEQRTEIQGQINVLRDYLGGLPDNATFREQNSNGRLNVADPGDGLRQAREMGVDHLLTDRLPDGTSYAEQGYYWYPSADGVPAIRNRDGTLQRLELVPGADGVGHVIAEATSTGEGSARLRYMGATPDKYSRTGLAVVERMRSGPDPMIRGEGDLLPGNPNNLEVRGPDGVWVRIDERVDMAHIVDAVSWWNDVGRFYGPKAPEVRQFMLDPNNYILQPRSFNRSDGARLGINYEPPVTPDFDTVE